MAPSLFLMIGCAVAVSLPRTLTLLTLWQLKEWRIDRLREHLRGEGLMNQIFGTKEPLLLLVLMIVAAAPGIPSFRWTWIALAVLAMAGASKIVTGRQPLPVRTQKAFILLGGSMFFLTMFGTALLLVSPLLLITLPILTPLAVFLAWLFFKPIDVTMKSRILKAAERLRASYEELTVIGIAGSVGKTTTKELLAHLLKTMNAIATPEHVNSELGVAKWMLKALRGSQKIDLLIVEMGAYRKGEIALLAKITKPHMGIVTHIGQDHLALFGSERAICEANAELLDALPRDGHAFLNADSDVCETLRAHCRCEVTTIGTGGHADIEAFDIEETAAGLRFSIGETTYDVPLHGTHNVTNILLAIATARQLGMNTSEVAERLRTFTPPKHTFEIRTEEGVTILDDTHNASPQSFRAAIEWARTQPQDKKILVTSGVIELGEDEGRIHMELGALAENVFDEAYILNKNFIHYFSLGFKKKELYGPEKKSTVPAGSLLVCIGRMKPSVIQSFLP